MLIILSVYSILPAPFSSHKVYAQGKEPLTCEDFIKLSKTAECKYYAIKADQGIWCGDEEADIYLGDEHAVYKDRVPDYTIAFDPLTCGNADNQTEKQTQPEVQESKQTTNPANVLSDWIKDTFSDLDFEAIETERLYGRTPQMTEEIIKQYQEEQRALSEEPGESPYRLDILNGQIQIKLPGQNEWSDLKQGDRIPPGSTIFTGMDTTTVLSIRDKGVVQILSFTEVTISEKGLAEPGKTTTEIDLRAGEVELNLPTGIFTGSLRVTTPTAHNAVRGTHFWVSYDKDKKLSTTGVYEGTVDVKVLGSDKSTLISPDGDKPGVVVIAKKLSTPKLILAGAVLVVLVGVILSLLKKRGQKTFLPKKKR